MIVVTAFFLTLALVAILVLAFAIGSARAIDGWDTAVLLLFMMFLSILSLLWSAQNLGLLS